MRAYTWGVLDGAHAIIERSDVRIPVIEDSGVRLPVDSVAILREVAGGALKRLAALSGTTSSGIIQRSRAGCTTLTAEMSERLLVGAMRSLRGDDPNLVVTAATRIPTGLSGDELRPYVLPLEAHLAHITRDVRVGNLTIERGGSYYLDGVRINRHNIRTLPILGGAVEYVRYREHVVVTNVARNRANDKLRPERVREILHLRELGVPRRTIAQKYGIKPYVIERLEQEVD